MQKAISHVIALSLGSWKIFGAALFMLVMFFLMVFLANKSI